MPFQPSFISNFNICSKFLFHVIFFTSTANFCRNELRKSQTVTLLVFKSFVLAPVMSWLIKTRHDYPFWEHLCDSILMLVKVQITFIIQLISLSYYKPQTVIVNIQQVELSQINCTSENLENLDSYRSDNLIVFWGNS